MALQVRDGTTWKTVNGAYVMQGGSWKPLRYLFVADGEYLTNPPPDPPPVDWVPIYATKWKLVRAFVPPHSTPPAPTLSAIPEHWEIDPPPRIDARATFPSFSGGGPVERSWTRELRFELSPDTGAPYSWSVKITDPDQTSFLEEWFARPAGYLKARMRYVNEAGAGAWSPLSNEIYVQPGGN